MGRKKKTFYTEKKVLSIYDRTRKLTKGFQNFSPEVLAKYPKCLFIIRLSLGMTQREMAKFLNLDRSTLTHHELGISKRINDKTLEKIKTPLNELIGKADFSKENVIRNFNNFWERAIRGQDSEKLRKWGRAALKSRLPNPYERKIMGILENKKIDFEREGTLTLAGMNYSFDFVIPNTSKPTLIIECKKISSTNKRSFRIICYGIAYEIGYKSRLLKSTYPETRLILVFDSSMKKLPERVEKILQDEIDYFMFNSGEKFISKTLNKIV